MRRLRTAVSAAVMSLMAAAPSSLAKSAPAKPAIEPEAVTALHNMGQFLRNQQNFSVQARWTTDDVLPSGQKVQYGGSVDLKVRRPDRLRMDITGDRRNEHIYYDGKTFTVFSDRVGYYAAFAAPGTLAELKTVLEKEYAFDLPLADLFYWGTERDETDAIQRATRIGTANIDGFVCDHFAFRQKDVDWELWIEQGGRPLPRKYVITTTSDKSKPQHTMVLNWDLQAKYDDQLFTFTPPPTAHQIDFDTKAHARKGGATP
ncbi:MAG TPA: DUF2092 domain-containing protein [Polyangia bacterium]|jgi:hypothetical protein|nr:DUF2092 domain-containing protein [Polyangia bacterium]